MGTNGTAGNLFRQHDDGDGQNPAFKGIHGVHILRLLPRRSMYVIDAARVDFNVYICHIKFVRTIRRANEGERQRKSGKESPGVLFSVKETMQLVFRMLVDYCSEVPSPNVKMVIT